MLLLALDTAGPDCAVALACDDDIAPAILSRRVERMGRGHAERLMPMVEATLAEAGHAFDDLDRIAVTTGPGSFTGVRVGIAAARALALSLDIPAVGVGSLAALAVAILHDHSRGTAVAVLDAKRGEIYAHVQDIASGAVLVEAAAMRVEDVARMLDQAALPLLLTGGAAPLLAGALADREARIAGTLESPDIAAVALLGLRAETASPPVPLYARGADAKPQAAKAVARA
jgi:tRNA threonylcarbamoyl adenosine modification protein YeaZ